MNSDYPLVKASGILGHQLHDLNPAQMLEFGVLATGASVVFDSQKNIRQPHQLASKLLRVVGLVLIAATAATGYATDGYFSDGYGVKSQGRAGVALTETDDAFGGANNPATTVWAADRLDTGISYFRPIRSADRTGATGPAAALNGRVTSIHDDFFVPEFGFKHALSRDVAVGVTVYGNGGMDTYYNPGQLNLGPGHSGLNLLAGPGALGVDLQQMLVAPTVAWKITPNQSVGLSPIIGYQRFKAYGISAFGGLSQDPTALTDRGYDQAFGGGVRVGYFWNITPVVAVGAAYSSPVFFQTFDKYRGLFAGNGSFDIPQNVGAGVGWQALPSLRLSVDYKWIDYADIAPVGNSSSNPGQLGQSGGPGFGWRSISVIKFGTDWNVTDHWTLRAGYSYNENPVPSQSVTFNILAPAVTQQHLTVGSTYEFGRQEVSVSYVHAFRNSVTGASQFVALGQAPAGTSETIAMYQDVVGVQYSYKF